MKIHFVGIGGIGVSALAGYYLKMGHQISGSDLASSEITEDLEKMGAKIVIGKHSKNLKLKIKNLKLLVYSPAVQEDNPELKMARKLNVKCLSYPEALGELTKQYFTIAVSGAHGKSTTTAMISLILEKAGLDPTVIIGAKLKEFNNRNFKVGKGKYLVIEADEWNASFLNYWPKIIVLTNIDKEHLDYYKDLKHILKTFGEYIGHLPENGILVANKDDKNISDNFFTAVRKLLYYYLGQKEAKKIKKILKIPGQHNVYNALAALTTARALKITDKISFKALSEYKGAWRRFEEKDAGKFKIISDYGHHPTEVKATLLTAREKFPKKQIWCVFQPHQYQRTFYLFKDFVKVFSQAPLDKIIITDIYDVAGREKKELKNKVSAKKLVLAINKKKVIYLAKEKIKDYLEENLNGGEVVIIMGAGDIYNLTEDLSNKKTLVLI